MKQNHYNFRSSDNWCEVNVLKNYVLNWFQKLERLRFNVWDPVFRLTKCWPCRKFTTPSSATESTPTSSGLSFPTSRSTSLQSPSTRTKLPWLERRRPSSRSLSTSRKASRTWWVHVHSRMAFWTQENCIQLLKFCLFFCEKWWNKIKLSFFWQLMSTPYLPWKNIDKNVLDINNLTQLLDFNKNP